MAYPINTIGGLNFIALEGRVDPPAQAVSIDSRSGVDGMEFTFHGKKANPFTLISIRDADDGAQAAALLATYKMMIDNNTWSLVQDDVPIPVDVYQIKVLAVTELSVKKITRAIGNKLSAQATVLQTCRWDLIAVPI